MKELIRKLVETSAPSGYEKAVRDLLRAEVGAYADEARVDALGNLILRKFSKSKDGQRIMLSAHMDEIGVIATHVDDNGFIYFTNIGGVRPNNHLGGRVRFINGVQGVIGSERNDNRERVLPLEKMFIDVGASSRKNCPINVGDVAVFDRPLAELNGRLAAKAMDDRIGVAVLAETLRQIKTSPHELFFVFSVQEEVGLRGATTSTYGIDPDMGIAVDVTLTGDTPKCARMAVALGKGPAIKVRDSGMLSDPRMVDWMVETARKSHIPYQLEVLEAGTTDAKAMQVTRAGVPAICLSVPCRYVHSPSEMVDYSDVQNAVHLLLELLSAPAHLSDL